MRVRSKWRDNGFDLENDRAVEARAYLTSPNVTQPLETPAEKYKGQTFGDVSPSQRPNVANVTNVTPPENENRGFEGPSTLGDISLLETDIEERAAIIAEGAGVPNEWAQGFAKMLAMKPPQGVTQRRWQQALDSAGRFIDGWAAKVAALGWTVEEVFGTHVTAPFEDCSRRGLAFFFREGDRVIAATADTVTFKSLTGAETRFYRQNVRPGGVAIWDLKPNS